MYLHITVNTQSLSDLLSKLEHGSQLEMEV